MQNTTVYRLALGIALAGSLLLVWLSLGVGIIGADGDPANKLYAAVIGAGLGGSCVARFRAPGMARVLFTMAILQAGIGLVAMATGLGQPHSGPLELALLNGFFAALFAAAGWLFLRAARQSELPHAAA
jgi:hypothetical protein